MQAVLEAAIERVTQVPATITAAGRTDAGAHALAQVIAFPTPSALSADDLTRALNAVLPRDVAIQRSCDVASTFHPRFDAESRAYRYLIYNRPLRSPLCERYAAHVSQPLDAQQMDAAAHTLVGRHDFGAFTSPAQTGSNVRTMFTAGCTREGDFVVTELRASGFRRQMVRSILGTLVLVGLHTLDLSDFVGIVASRDRRQAGRTMPAHGLYLIDVRYPPNALSDPTREPEECTDGVEEKA